MEGPWVAHSCQIDIFPLQTQLNKTLLLNSMDFFFLHKKNVKIVLEMHDLQKFSYAFLLIDLDFWPNTAEAMEELLSTEET